MSQANQTRTTRNDGSHINMDNTNMDNESSEDIKHRIDRTREAMDETLDELGERLNPHTLLDEAIAIFRSPRAKGSAKAAGGMVGDFAQNLGRQVRDNPIPTLLVGAGLAWLAFTSHDDEDDEEYGRRRRSRSLRLGTASDDYALGIEDEDAYFMDDELVVHESLESGPVTGAYASGDFARDRQYRAGDRDEGGESMASRAKHTASSIGESASETASSVGETISHAATSTKDAITGAASTIGSAFSSAGDTASSAARSGYQGARQGMRSTYRGAAGGTRRAGRSAQHAYRSSVDQLSEVCDMTSHRLREAHQDYPLGVGLGCLALGALAGLMIPRTRQEDEWMGESADHFREEAWEAGEEALEHGKEAVQETFETAKHSAEKHGLTGDTLLERATHVVEKAAGSLSEAAKEEGLHPRQLKEEAKQVAKETSEKAKEEVGVVSEEARKKAGQVDPDIQKATEGAKSANPRTPR